MAQKLDTIEMQNALALSQAACYASMSAKEHEEHSDQAMAMLRLTNKLVDMSIASLDAAIIPLEIAAPGELVLSDYVNQAKADAAAAVITPDPVVMPITLEPVKDTEWQAPAAGWGVPASTGSYSSMPDTTAPLPPTVAQSLVTDSTSGTQDSGSMVGGTATSGADNNIVDHIDPLPSDPLVPVPDAETNSKSSIDTLTTNTTPAPTVLTPTPTATAAPGVTEDQTPVPELGPDDAIVSTTVQGNLTGPEENKDYKPLPVVPASTATTVTDPNSTALAPSQANALPAGAASPASPVGPTVV